MRIKVCGLTQPDQMHVLGELGIQFGGLIFNERSPRYIGHFLRPEELKAEKLKIFKVGVFVNAGYDEIQRQIDAYGLDMVQLHGNETPYACGKIGDYIQVIKAFRIMGYDNIEYKIRDFYQDADLFLFDNGIGGLNANGHSEKFNWNRLKTLRIDKPWLLGGGIGPEDAAELRQFAQHPVAKTLFALDIDQRFETAPGVKDMELIRTFAAEILMP